ncbi:MAG: hypothetical protein ACK5LC_12990 [Coprobacillaceae bacterium]
MTPVDDLITYASGVKDTYSDINGVTYNYESNDKEFIETITFELTAKTVNDIKKAGILSSYYGDYGDTLEAKQIFDYMKNSNINCK